MAFPGTTQRRGRGAWAPHFLVAAAAVALALQPGLGELLVAYCAVALCFLPATPLDLAFGARFGIPLGILWAQLSATLAAAVAFLFARHVLRGRLPGFLRRDERLSRIESVVARHGGWSVFLARLSPFLPFSALSWIFGASRVSFGAYLAATFLATLPKTIAYVSIGATAGRLAGSGPIATDGRALPVAGSLVVLVSAALLARRWCAQGGRSASAGSWPAR